MTGKKRKPHSASRRPEKGASRNVGHKGNHEEAGRERPGAKRPFDSGAKASFKPGSKAPYKKGRPGAKPPYKSGARTPFRKEENPTATAGYKPYRPEPVRPEPVRQARVVRPDRVRESHAPVEKVKHEPRTARASAVLSGGRGAPFWLYGLHAARAALANENRKIRKAVLTARAASELGAGLLKGLVVEPAEAEIVSRLLPQGAVHQGIALLCEPLPSLDLSTLLGVDDGARKLVAVLDQVTDPQNEGAILRSAAAFGIAAVIVQDRHSPPESGALAKAASGALDLVPRISVVNIARALDELGELGFWRIALAADGDMALREAGASGNIAVVLGAEGTGIRRLVRERCDAAAFVPMSGPIESLNVSNAAAIAFYELSQARKK